MGQFWVEITCGGGSVLRGNQHRGIGSAFVSHLLYQAAARNEDILWVECAPESSAPFWSRMEFITHLDSDGRKLVAYRILPRKLTLPDQGTPVAVLIEWYPEKREWNRSVAPLASTTMQGMADEDEVLLPARACGYDGANRGHLVTRVVVDGTEWLCGRAKDDDASEAGIERCQNGWYFDSLYRP